MLGNYKQLACDVSEYISSAPQQGDIHLEVMFVPPDVDEPEDAMGPEHDAFRSVAETDPASIWYCTVELKSVPTDLGIAS